MRKVVRKKINDTIEAYDLEGKVLEIGGYKFNQCAIDVFNEPRFKYYSLDLEKNDIPNNIIGDITNVKNIIEDNTFDIVYCSDVFEHVKEPWKAAIEIQRILKPGGIVFIYTVWSWRHHPLPVDFWRFSADALKFLFKDTMEPIENDFDLTQRRDDIRGFWANKLDHVPIDELGGWRENWGVYYIGKKIKNNSMLDDKDNIINNQKEEIKKLKISASYRFGMITLYPIRKLKAFILGIK